MYMNAWPHRAILKDSEGRKQASNTYTYDPVARQIDYFLLACLDGTISMGGEMLSVSGARTCTTIGSKYIKA